MTTGSQKIPRRLVRNALLAAVILAVLYSILLAGRDAIWSDTNHYLGCWLSPNASLSLIASLSLSCPLESYEIVDRVRLAGVEKPVSRRADLFQHMERFESSIEVHARKGQRERWVSIPVLIDQRSDRIGRFLVASLTALLALGFAAAVYLTSPTSISGAVLATTACIASLILCILCGSRSSSLDLQWILSVGFLPAAFWHLALVFPDRRPLVREVPGVLPVLYMIFAVLAVMGISASYRIHHFGGTIEQLHIALFLLSLLFITLSCVRQLSRPISPLHRAQARAFLIGLVLIAGLPTALGVVNWPHFPDGRLGAVTFGLVLAPGPIALLVTRSAFLNSGVYARVIFGRVAEALGLATLCSIALLLLHQYFSVGVDASVIPTVWAMTFVASFLLSSLTRASASRKSSTRVEPTNASPGERTGTAGQRQTEEQAGHVLEQEIRGALSPESLAIFVRVNGAPERPLRGTESTLCNDDTLARRAFDLMEEWQVSEHLNPWDHPLGENPAAREFQRAGIALIHRLPLEPPDWGVVLLGFPSGWPGYTALHTARLSQICERAALAIKNAWLIEELEEQAYYAARGHTAAEVAHDLSKPIQSIFNRAMTSLRSSDVSGNLTEDLLAIARLASDSKEVINAFLQKSARDRSQNLEVILADAAACFSQAGGRDQIFIRTTPNLPEVADSGGLKRVIRNLLENAIEASRHGQQVQVYARRHADHTIVEVIDVGEGMPPEVLDRAFEHGFSTKASGSGLGLASCQAIVQKLGASVSLSSTPGKGTKARVVIPRATYASAED